VLCVVVVASFSYLTGRKAKIGSAKMADFSTLITKNASLDAPIIKGQAKKGFATGAVLFDLGGNGVFWQKKGVTLRGLRISDKKEILRKLTVFNDGGNWNCRSLLSRCLASIRGPSLLIIELWKDDPLQYMTVAVACTIAHL
jgi:hypothetical protein